MIKNIYFVLIFFIVSAILFLQFKSTEKKSEMESVYRTLENCNVQENKCKVNIEKIYFNIVMDKDIFYLKKFNVDVFVDNEFKEKIKSIKVYFKMKNMNMGNNVFVLNKLLLKKERQNWNTAAVLPICVSGRADWVAALEVIIENKIYIIEFPIQVKK